MLICIVTTSKRLHPEFCLRPEVIALISVMFTVVVMLNYYGVRSIAAVLVLVSASVHGVDIIGSI